MPSVLTAHNVEYVAGRPFTYNGDKYDKGDEVPDAQSFNNLESMVRARYLIPVVDNYSEDAPTQFRHAVMTRELALKKLGLDVVKTPQEPVEEPENDEFDPAEHTVDEVLDHVENHPDEVLSVYALEEEGKARSTLLKKLDEILNNQAEDENEESEPEDEEHNE